MFEADGEINYAAYSRAQLEEVLSRIDKERYPRNYENLLRELGSRSPDSSHEPEKPTTPDAGVAEVDRSSRTRRIGAVWGFLLCMLLIVYAGLDQTISMGAAFEYVIPGIGALGCLGFYLWLLFKVQPAGDNGRARANLDFRDARQVLLAIGVIVFPILVGLLVRDAMRTVGAMVGGDVRATSATVQSTRVPLRARNRCREFATFELHDGRVAEVCVRHTFRSDLIHAKLGVGETVILLIQKNVIGDTVVRIERHVADESATHDSADNS